MTDKTQSPQEQLQTLELSQDDPRNGLAQVIGAVHPLFTQATADPTNMAKPTPCADFTVADLLGHMIFVAHRVSAMGRGENFEDVPPVTIESGWADAFRQATGDIRVAWDDTAQLEQLYTTPFGQVPGAAVMYVYTCEFGVHGWDLGQALGASFAVGDEHLQGALAASKTLPAEGREDPDMPFGPVVAVPDDAPALDQIAGWMGRPVS